MLSISSIPFNKCCIFLHLNVQYYFLAIHDLHYQLIYLMQCMKIIAMGWIIAAGQSLQQDNHCSGTIITVGQSLQQDNHCSRTGHCNGTIIAMGQNIAMGRDTTIRRSLQRSDHCNRTIIATGQNIAMGRDIAVGQTVQHMLQQYIVLWQ